MDVNKWKGSETKTEPFPGTVQGGARRAIRSVCGWRSGQRCHHVGPSGSLILESVHVTGFNAPRPCASCYQGSRAESNGQNSRTLAHLLPERLEVWTEAGGEVNNFLKYRIRTGGQNFTISPQRCTWRERDLAKSQGRHQKEGNSTPGIYLWPQI